MKYTFILFVLSAVINILVTGISQERPSKFTAISGWVLAALWCGLWLYTFSSGGF